MRRILLAVVAVACLVVLTGCPPSGKEMPVGNLPGWTQIMKDDFITETVPLGAFSDCNHFVDTAAATCEGLKPYPHTYENWWAYPRGWMDTAYSQRDGNTGAPFGGEYRADTTTEIRDGVMRVRMFQPTTQGPDPRNRNHVATLVPRKCMDRTYGRYVERSRVVTSQNGFKYAHLLYNPPHEMDFPEVDKFTADNGATYEKVMAFSHPRNLSTGEGAYATNARVNEWHDYTIEWKPGSVEFFVDGVSIGKDTNDISSAPDDWRLQNESSIYGPFAQPGYSATLEFDWVTCYAYTP